MAIRPLVFSPAAALRYAFNLPDSRLTACRTAVRHNSFYQPRIRTKPLPLSPSLPPQPTRRKSGSIPKDEEIGDGTVQLVQEDGSLAEPVSLRDALQSFDREKNFLVRVAPPGPDRFSVCKIVSKDTLRDQQRSKTKSKTTGSMAPKQLELNWAIDEHDLSHRLKQMESFLDKGRKVHLILNRKKGKRLATLDEAESLFNAVQQRIKDSGATEIKPVQGKLLRRLEFVLAKNE